MCVPLKQLVDSMLWMSFERQINAFRMNVLGLEPLRVGEGGWNHLNIMKVRTCRQFTLLTMWHVFNNVHFNIKCCPQMFLL